MTKNLSKLIFVFVVLISIVIAKVNYDENFDPNKKFHVKDSKVPKKQKKNKAKKRIKKIVDSLFIINMYNDVFKKYDSFVSIKKIFMKNKINIFGMKFIAGSLEVCKKMKKMCIKIFQRISKKTNSNDEFVILSQFFFAQSQNFSEQFFQSFQFFQPVSILQYFQSFQYFQFFQINMNISQISSEYISQSFQQLQSFQQSMISDLQFSLILKLFKFVTVHEKVLGVEIITKNLKRNTRFLNTMINVDKIFRVSCIILNIQSDFTSFDKRFVQVDQNSNMNVINIELIKKFKLNLHFLNEIKFREFFMRTANHHDIVLHHGMGIKIQIEKIIKNICCFVISNISRIINTDQIKHMNLILNFSGLFFVNAFLVRVRTHVRTRLTGLASPYLIRSFFSLSQTSASEEAKSHRAGGHTNIY